MINLFKIINKKFFYFLDDWCGGVFMFLSSLTMILSSLLLETHFSKIHFAITVAYLSFFFVYMFRRFFVVASQVFSSPEEKISSKKPSKTITINLENYEKIINSEDNKLDFYYTSLLQMVKKGQINICYDGQMTYHFFTPKTGELLIAIYDNEEDCLFIHRGHKSLYLDKKRRSKDVAKNNASSTY